MRNLMTVNPSDSLSVAEALRIAAEKVARGDVVAFPTDSVYGLACDPWNPEAVAKLFRVKGRPEWKPVLLLIDCLARAETLTRDVPPCFSRLARRFSPGPLTYVLPAALALPRDLTAGTGKIGVRLPAVDFARRLAEACGGAVTATSANRSGKPAATSGSMVLEQFGQEVDLILDAGESATSTVSTVIDLTVVPPLILREGAVPSAELKKALSEE